MDGIVCPFSMAGDCKQCSPYCKLLDENNKCLFVEFLKKSVNPPNEEK